MKTQFRIIVAAMAASMAFISCTKEIEIENGKGAQTTDGVREIEIAFANSTKTALDDLKPIFIGGEYILVSNGTDKEVITVTISNGKSLIKTTLPGALTAVYPSGAAVLSGNSITGVKVPATQNGTFSDANIAMAELAETETKMMFHNQTALFKITPPSGVTSFTITSLKQIGSDGHRSGSAVAINTTGTSDAARQVITVSAGSALGTWYVALKAGVKLSDLSFDTGNAMKGIPEKDITTNQTAVNKLYTISNANWHEYAIIGGTKWAKTNVGAGNEADAGAFFSWGGTQGQTLNGSTWSNGGFTWDNYPHSNGALTSSNSKVMIKYVKTADTKYWAGSGSPDNKTVLDLRDDAAYANWGGAWRMPVKTEAKSLADYAYAWDSARKGYSFKESSGSIFIPASGIVSYSVLSEAGVQGYLWTSELYNTRYPNIISISETKCQIANGRDRNYGMNIRPVAD